MKFVLILWAMFCLVHPVYGEQSEWYKSNPEWQDIHNNYKQAVSEVYQIRLDIETATVEWEQTVEVFKKANEKHKKAKQIKKDTGKIEQAFFEYIQAKAVMEQALAKKRKLEQETSREAWNALNLAEERYYEAFLEYLNHSN